MTKTNHHPGNHVFSMITPARPVFQHPTKATVEVPKGENRIARQLEERERENNVNTPKVAFSGNPDADIPEIARKAFPDKPEMQDYYTRKIEASFKAYLQEGKTVKDLWKYLDSQQCTFEQVIMGILRFFKGDKGQAEININEFLKPLELKAKSSVREVLDEERSKQIEKTSADLGSLLSELRAQHPDLPPLPNKNQIT